MTTPGSGARQQKERVRGDHSASDRGDEVAGDHRSQREITEALHDPSAETTQAELGDSLL